MAGTPEVGSLKDFGGILLAALVAGFLLYVYRIIKGKALTAKAAS